MFVRSVGGKASIATNIWSKNLRELSPRRPRTSFNVFDEGMSQFTFKVQTFRALYLLLQHFWALITSYLHQKNNNNNTFLRSVLSHCESFHLKNCDLQWGSITVWINCSLICDMEEQKPTLVFDLFPSQSAFWGSFEGWYQHVGRWRCLWGTWMLYFHLHVMPGSSSSCDLFAILNV